MHIPDSFAWSLHDQFDGKFRVRWSVKTLRFQIEEKLRCAVLPPIHIEADDDDLIRAVEGYGCFAEVCPGTLTPCGRCGKDRHATVRDFIATACAHCGDRAIAVFWPLDDSLLQHLRYTDPNRGGYDVLRSNRDRNLRMNDLRLKSAFREADARAVDDVVFTLPKVGYTGREHMWIR